MADSPNRQKEIFLKAIEMPSADERAAFLVQACGADEELRRQIDAMLQAHGTPDSFLEKPAAAMGATLDADSAAPQSPTAPDDNIGTRIGPYKLLEQIGAGGMGVVYTADQQEPVRRKVALKIIKPGMDSGQVLARFEAERQALALMDHPNIAKVLDAGATKEGRPYFVMELVKGTPITKFCDERRLSPRERLELFVQVCQAIQHAHQKGVIHRDIKPSNVLVALYDDKPVPKVIDFGVAKATGQALTEKTLDTGFGAIVGTPEYMSPEQATFNQLDIDTRSDVYALGVLLYELLTGTTPVDKARLKEAALLEVLRIVREDEPPRPSVKMSTSKASATIAKTCGIDANELSRLLRGELDWIVMKSLEKDRNRRYDTAASLARDVERYLKDDLVEARPPSVAYRFQKTLRKNRGPVVAASLFLLALIGGVIGTTASMLRAWDADGRTRDANQTIQANLLEIKGLNAKANKARDDAVESARRAKRDALRAETARHAIQMDSIHRDFERNDLIAAISALNEVPDAFRKTWEYRYVRDLCFRRAFPVDFTDPSRHSYVPWPISPDGKSVAAIRQEPPSTKAPSHLRIWDADSGKEKWNRAGVHTTTFSRDGKRVAVSVGHELKILDTETGREQLTVVPKTKDAHCWRLAFSPDDKLLATTWKDGVLVLDAATGKVKFNSIQKSKYGFGVLAFDATGKRLATSWEAGVKIFDVESGQVKHSLKSIVGNSFFSISFNPDGKRLLQCKNYDISEWSIETGQFIRFVPVDGFQARDAGYTADGKSIVLIGNTYNPIVKLIEAETGKEKAIPNPLGATTCSSLDRDGRRLATSGGNTGTLFVWTIGTIPSRKYSVEGVTSSNWGFASNDTVYSFAKNSLTSWNLQTGAKLGSVDMKVSGKSYEFADVKLHTIGNRKIVAIYNHDLILADGETGKEIQVFKGYPGLTLAGQRLAYVDVEKELIKICALKTGQEQFTLPCEKVTGVTFSPDGDQLAAACFTGELAIFDLKSGKRTVTVTEGKGVPGIGCFSPDGKSVLSARQGGVYRTWSTSTGEELCAPMENREGGDLHFSPDGNRIFWGKRVFDAETGQAVFKLPSNIRAISPDGRRVLTTPTANRVEILDAP